MLDRSAQFYEEINPVKEMAAQVLVVDLPFGCRGVGNDPPPLNMENFHLEDILCCLRRRIVPPKISPRRLRRIMSSDNPAPDTVYCWMTEYI